MRGDGWMVASRRCLVLLTLHPVHIVCFMDQVPHIIIAVPEISMHLSIRACSFGLMSTERVFEYYTRTNARSTVLKVMCMEVTE